MDILDVSGSSITPFCNTVFLINLHNKLGQNSCNCVTQLIFSTYITYICVTQRKPISKLNQFFVKLRVIILKIRT